MLRHTGADALMIGRAAQGRPWIFREIAHFLDTGRRLPPPIPHGFGILLEHLDDHYGLYGERMACASRASTSAGRQDAARRRGISARMNAAETARNRAS